MDHTSIHPSSADQAHRIDLHLWRGAPENLDEDHPVEILVNDGYVIGFCPTRLQPAWSAYRVAGADDEPDFDRPLMYYNDMRLPEDHRIGPKTFGKIGGTQLHVGHMTPNQVINRQFGRLAQLETFLMSNMSPQHGTLNTGVWLKLENAIREIEEVGSRDHVWAIVGPVFGDQPAMIDRGHGRHLPIPEKYFCVIVDPHSYPYNIPSAVNADCFLIPQDAPSSSFPQDYPATLDEVEEATGLHFFAKFGRDLPIGSVASTEEGAAPPQSRLMALLEEQRHQADQEPIVETAADEITTIDGLIELLEAEAAHIQVVGRALTPDELEQLRTIQHTISWLIRARDIIDPPPPPPPPTMITYKIISDRDDLLKRGARTACNFWNRFVQPNQSIVIRLGVFTQNSNTIARAYQPYFKDGTRYGRVEFNTKYLTMFTDEQIAGTIAHEIGHSLGIGWDDWQTLYSKADGQFTGAAIASLAELAQMEVELEGGPGTEFAHWDEQRFDKELMTGYQDSGEYVLPVTIDLMAVLGHTVVEPLNDARPLSDLLNEVAGMIFSRQDEIEQLDLEHFEATELMETIPHPRQQAAAPEA